MDKQSLSRNRGRAHRMLFNADLPFKGKVEQSKKTYTRKAKHRLREQ